MVGYSGHHGAMNNTTFRELHQQLESLLRMHLDAQRAALVAVVESAYASSTPRSLRRSEARAKSPGERAASRATQGKRERRPDTEIAALAERLCAAVEAEPGVGMTRLAAHLGMSPRDLDRPMTRLKFERRVRTVGRYQSMRYFPLST